MLAFKGEYIMLKDKERNLFILDVVGCLLSIASIFLLMFIMSFVHSLMIVVVVAFFIFTVFQFVQFLDSMILFIKQRKVKKYSNSKVSVMKYKYLIW